MVALLNSSERDKFPDGIKIVPEGNAGAVVRKVVPLGKSVPVSPNLNKLEPGINVVPAVGFRVLVVKIDSEFREDV